MTQLRDEWFDLKSDMAGHHPPGSRRWDALETSVTVSDSASGRIRRAIKLETERRTGERKAKEENSRKEDPKYEDLKGSTWKPLPDLPGSDIHLSPTRMCKVIRIVQTWIRRNDAWVDTYGKRLDNRSVISFVGGVTKERPALNVGTWRKSIGLQGTVDKNEDSSAASSFIFSSPSSRVNLGSLLLQSNFSKKDASNRLHATVSSYTDSSRASVINLGSLLLQSSSSEREILPKGHRRQVSVSSSTDSSRESAINFGSVIRQSLSLTEKRQKKSVKFDQAVFEAAQIDCSSQKLRPVVSVLNGRSMPLVAKKSTHQLKRDYRQIPRKPVPQTERRDRGNGDCFARAEKEKNSTKPYTEEILDGELPNINRHVRYSQSRKYDTSELSKNARMKRVERRSSTVNNEDRRHTVVQELTGHPNLGNDRNVIGGNSQKSKELSQSAYSNRSRPKFFMGSLDPEYVRPRGLGLPATQYARRTVSERRDLATNDRHLECGISQEGKKVSQPQLGRSGGQSREETDQGCLQTKEPGISNAIKNSRRRRSEGLSVPLTNQYRYEQRKKAWTLRSD